MPPSIRATSPGTVDVLALQDLEAGGGGADCIGGALSCGRRSSFSYHRLPDPRLRLTVRKLDGSFFDVEIARSAAVWELKVAIEELFFTLFDDTDKTISWQHVWSHFCLCFKDEKLTDDKATLRAFGIRDGDEEHKSFAEAIACLAISFIVDCNSPILNRNPGCHDDLPFVCTEYHNPDVTVKSVRLDKLHFAQHLSVDYSPCKSLSENQKAVSHRRSTTWLDDFNKDEGEKFIYSRCSTSVLEDLCIEEYSEERVEEGRRKKRSLFHGWFSFSRFRSNRRTHAEDTVPLSCEKKNTGPKLGKWLSSKRFN